MNSIKCLIKRVNIIALIGIASMFVIQCTNPVEYDTLVQQELDSGVRNDSLFLGIYFGMTSKEFYDHCWKLNKQNVLINGMGNMTASYKLTELKYPATFEFYPSFSDDKINIMPSYVYYNAWSPWNKDLSVEVLIEDMKNVLEKWYESKFYPIEPTQIFGNAYVSVQGNRKIIIQYAAENKVEVIYTDLSNTIDLPVVIKN